MAVAVVVAEAVVVGAAVPVVEAAAVAVVHAGVAATKPQLNLKPRAAGRKHHPAALSRPYEIGSKVLLP